MSGCISSVDAKCTCPSVPFKDALTTCLKAACTENDITGKLFSHSPDPLGFKLDSTLSSGRRNDLNRDMY